jgi:hypothetical protein
LIGGAGLRTQAATAVVRALPAQACTAVLKERCAQKRTVARKKEHCAYVPGKI